MGHDSITSHFVVLDLAAAACWAKRDRGREGVGCVAIELDVDFVIGIDVKDAFACSIKIIDAQNDPLHCKRLVIKHC